MPVVGEELAAQDRHSLCISVFLFSLLRASACLTPLMTPLAPGQSGCWWSGLPPPPIIPALRCSPIICALCGGGWACSVPPQCFCICCSFSWNASCLPGDQPVRCGQSLVEGPPHTRLLFSPPIRGDSLLLCYSPCITSVMAPSVFVYMSSITPRA